MYRYEFYSDNHLRELINDNKDKYIISIEYLKIGNFVTFSDTPTIEILQREHGNKISILEQENQALKEELTQIQASIASLTSLLATTLEEK